MRNPPVSLHSWLIEPLPKAVMQSIDCLRCLEDVRHVALMPDVHLARDVCIGTFVATEQLVYPAAVGGDIGCGMTTAVPPDYGMRPHQPTKTFGQ